MAKGQKNLQVGNNCIGYVFKCGCRMPLSYGVDCSSKKKPITCPVHGVKWTHKVCVCFECRTIFLTGSRKPIPRCAVCQKDARKSQVREAHKKHVAKGYVYSVKKSKKEKSVIDQSRRWECVHGDDCINGECFRNVKFNCHGCEKFKKKNMELDFYSKENMEHIYA